MAGNKNSGGMRPTAPQNNPANVSGTGGNGQSGTNVQAKRYIPGMMKSFGTTGASTYQQEGAAPLYADPSAPSAPRATITPATLSEITPITAPTERPDEHIMHGSPTGPGANSIPNLPPENSNDPDIQAINENLPLMEFWASQPGSSQATKDYVSYLKTTISNPGAPR